MSTTDRDYLERRYRESMTRAETAADPGIARVHREFAARYAKALDTESRDKLHITQPR